MPLARAVLVSVALSVAVAPSAHADSGDDLQKFVDGIRSVSQVKAAIAGDLRRIDACATGSCVNNNATQICDYVAALDVQLAGAISGPNQSHKSARFEIEESDLDLFRTVWSACKPTTYQFWNFGRLLHVWYEADAATDATIRAGLGVAAKPSATRSEPARQLPPIRPR